MGIALTKIVQYKAMKFLIGAIFNPQMNAVNRMGEVNMTAKDKGELIVYINYLKAKGEEARRTARKPGTVPSMVEWLLGTGNARMEIANELMLFLERSEVEWEDENRRF